MRVEVYWNLHKLCWSVRALGGESKGRVIQHTGELNLKDCTMAVQPAGNARVRKEKRKNVHAFIRGTIVTRSPHPPFNDSVCVTYNPYQHKSFMQYNPDPHSECYVCVSPPRDLTPIYKADRTVFFPDRTVRAWARGKKRGVAWGTAKGRRV